MDPGDGPCDDQSLDLAGPLEDGVGLIGPSGRVFEVPSRTWVSAPRDGPYRPVSGSCRTESRTHLRVDLRKAECRSPDTWGPALFNFIATVIAAPNAGCARIVSRVGGRVGRHSAWPRIGWPAPDSCARVRSGPVGLTDEPVPCGLSGSRRSGALRRRSRFAVRSPDRSGGAT
jgi:hypothetical protein